MVTVTFSENRTRFGLLFSLAFLAAVSNEDFFVDCKNKAVISIRTKHLLIQQIQNFVFNQSVTNAKSGNESIYSKQKNRIQNGILKLINNSK